MEADLLGIGSALDQEGETARGAGLASPSNDTTII